MFAYIDPGQGFIFLQNTPILWVIFLGLLTFAAIFFRLIKKLLWLVIIIAVAIIIWGALMNKGLHKDRKFIIIAIDAMEPKIADALMKQGGLPNLSSLKAAGAYSSLKTTVPAESVVAWTSFLTGLNPGDHGVFDFIMRDPKNYQPYLSLNEASRSYAKGEPFWNILSKNGIESRIYFCPNTFPAGPLSGRMISGMGVPDVYGVIGRFSFYTGKAMTEKDAETRGKIVKVPLGDNLIHAYIFGPKVSSLGRTEESKVPLKITVYPKEEKTLLEFQNNRVTIKRGQWSDWQRIRFNIGPIKKAHGIVRFYLKNVKDGLELYMSPVNFDPERPLFPISYPRDLSRRLARKVGLYYTQGMPHDTWAFTEGRLDEKAFLEQVDTVLEGRKKILREELKDFKKGVFFFYFDTLDIIQHMFWRYPDKETIYEYYEKMDEIVGEVLRSADKDTTIVVLSDHGFNSFDRAVHLNRWLLENGFLALKAGAEDSKGLFDDVDWAKTKAYALGFGGIYINRIGREARGIVSASDAEWLKETIAAKLARWQDPKTQKRVIKKVYLSEEVFKGLYEKDAPDLFVGFDSGFRVSWQTALGGVPKGLLEDNNKQWSGEHLVDPDLVPGVLFANKRLNLKGPSIIDAAPTVLEVFGIPKGRGMRGRAWFKKPF